MTAAELHEHAVEVDTKLAELHGALGKVFSNLDGVKKALASRIGLEGKWGTGPERRSLVYHHYLLEAVVEIAEGKLADGTIDKWEVERVKELLAKIPTLIEERRAIRAQMEPLDAEFVAKRWSRFFLVTSSAGGHIHKDTSCGTTRARTTFAWLPELSGLTEKDAVEAHGAILCSVCFPTAPVEWTVGNAPEKPRCPGTGTADYDETTYRRNGWSGNGYAVCNHCNTSQTVTKSLVLRAHKPKVEA